MARNKKESLSENMLEDINAFINPGRRLRAYIARAMTENPNNTHTQKISTILTEEFSRAGFHVYDPNKSTWIGSPHNECEVFVTNYLNVSSSDVCFFIRNCPSHGMGIEAHICADFLIPWTDYRALGNATSPMVGGLANPIAIRRFEQKNLSELRESIRVWLSDHVVIQRLNQAAVCRQDVRRVIKNAEIGLAIRTQRLMMLLGTNELSQLVGISPLWLECIERSPDAIAGLTMIQLARLMDVLDLKAINNTQQPFACPKFVPRDRIDNQVYHQAVKFAKWSLSVAGKIEGINLIGESLLQRWHDHVKELRMQLPKHQKTRLQKTPHKLKCYVAMPMSKSFDTIPSKIVQQACEDCRKSTGIEIEPVFPEYQSFARSEHSVEIYLKTLQKLTECDFGILNATPSATGVGVMTQLFTNASMPIVVTAEQGFDLSRMLCGGIGSKIGSTIRYESVSELSSKLSNAMVDNVHELCDSASTRRQAIQELRKLRVERGIDHFRIPRKQSVENTKRYIQKIRFARGEWAYNAMSNPNHFPHVTLAQLVHLAKELNWKVTAHPSGLPTIRPLPALAKDAVKEVVKDKSNSRELTADDLELIDLSMWNLLTCRNNSLYKDLEDDQIYFKAWYSYSLQVLGEYDNFDSLKISVSTWESILKKIGEPEEDK